MINIISNIINCIGTTSNMIGINLKDKRKVLICFIIGNSCVSVALGLLNAISGMLIQAVFVIETIINYFWEKKHDKYPTWMVLLYVIIPCIMLALSYKTMWDILPIIGGVMFPLALVSKDLKLRLLNLFSVFAWVPYNLHVGQYVGFVSCIIFVIINAVAVIRLDILKKESK